VGLLVWDPVVQLVWDLASFLGPENHLVWGLGDHPVEDHGDQLILDPEFDADHGVHSS